MTCFCRRGFDDQNSEASFSRAESGREEKQCETQGGKRGFEVNLEEEALSTGFLPKCFFFFIKIQAAGGKNMKG